MQMPATDLLLNNMNVVTSYYSKKVKFALEQAMKAHRGSRGVVLLFL